ncbi:hypothetical protein QN399_26190, partial [Pseudomonas sp. 10C3]|nr:hypothetical protein [Pseudomonas sp. 10C3]
MSDAHMDFGLGLPAVFGWQMTLGGPFACFCLTAFVGPATFGLMDLGLGRSLEEAGAVVLDFLPSGLQIGAWGGGAVLLMFLIISLNHLAKYETLVPTRFNRQRREVCFVP